MSDSDNTEPRHTLKLSGPKPADGNSPKKRERLPEIAPAYERQGRGPAERQASGPAPFGKGPRPPGAYRADSSRPPRIDSPRPPRPDGPRPPPRQDSRDDRGAPRRNDERQYERPYQRDPQRDPQRNPQRDDRRGTNRAPTQDARRAYELDTQREQSREQYEDRPRRAPLESARLATGVPRKAELGPAPDPHSDIAASGGIRLNKRMADLGLASRREADVWIERGWVSVNGKVARMGQPVMLEDRIDIDPAAQREQAQSVTILLNKPIGYVSAQPEDGYRPAAELITAQSMHGHGFGPQQLGLERWHFKNLGVCGRLDIDSTGLLIFSQDGRIARELIGNDSDMEKEYLVRVSYAGAPESDQQDEDRIKQNVKAVFPEEDLELLRYGLEIDGQPLLPAKVSWQNEEQLRFVLREGKKRQIRRMCEAVGLRVEALKRVRVGRVVLGDLPLGQWRFLQPHERF